MVQPSEASVAHGPQADPSLGLPSTAPIAFPHPRLLPRWFAVIQVLAVCGIPTGVFLTFVLVLFFNMPIFDGDSLSLEFFATLSLFDTALIALLIRVFLILSGEESRDVFLGKRKVFGELWRGLALLPVALIGVNLFVLGLRAIAPWLHTVKDSPIAGLMRTPFDAAIFLVVVVLAGGVREELQRAFILHRFGQCLGGIRLGLGIFTVTFGLLHLDQGADVAIAVGLLGLLWGVLYIKRRSAVMSMANHAAFNAANVAQQMFLRSVGS